MNQKYLVGGLLALILCSLVSLVLLALGQRDPTPQERDNARATGALLTAVAMKNPRLLEESAKLAKQRHDAGQLTDAQYQGMEAVINKARAGDWSGAEKDGYEFRKKYPFVKEGR